MKRRDLLKGLTMAAGGALCSGPSWNHVGAEVESKTTARLAKSIRGLARRDGSFFQPLQVTVQNGGPSAVAITKLDGVEIDRRTVPSGSNVFELYLKPATRTQSSTVSVHINDTLQTETVEFKPVRQMLVYILPHSHHDLGYTDLQAMLK